LYPFVPLLLSFVPQRVRRYSAFQFLHNPYVANLTNFKDIEMGPTAFERESFVPVRTSLTFVCTSKDSEIQRVSVFAQPLHSKFSEFQRYGTNGIRKRIVCTRLYLYYFRLYLKVFGDTFVFLRNLYIANLANFKDIEMGPMAFERESFVPVCTSITFVCTSKSSEIQCVSIVAQPLYSISEPLGH